MLETRGQGRPVRPMRGCKSAGNYEGHSTVGICKSAEQMYVGKCRLQDGLRSLLDNAVRTCFLLGMLSNVRQLIVLISHMLINNLPFKKGQRKTTALCIQSTMAELSLSMLCVESFPPRLVEANSKSEASTSTQRRPPPVHTDLSRVNSPKPVYSDLAAAGVPTSKDSCLFSGGGLGCALARYTSVCMADTNACHRQKADKASHSQIPDSSVMQRKSATSYRRKKM
eukprot:scaffold217275_cov40-Prasinocladus_malaysianus.AAC.2